jgi:hypothetical protein
MKRVVSEPGSPATNGAPSRELLVAFEAFHVPIGEKQRPIGERGATTEFRTGSYAIQRSKNGRADIVAKC